MTHHLDRRADTIVVPDGDPDRLFTTVETAAMLGVSEQFLEIGRSKGYGPKFIRLSPRRTRYRRVDIQEWLQSRLHASTAEYGDSDIRVGRKPGSRVVDGRVIPPDQVA